MRILVVSDSHSALSCMLRCAEVLKPDVIIHLGDHYDDGEVLRDSCPNARVYLLPGNCDRYRVPGDVPEILMDHLDGLKFYMTHGHRHAVKSTMGILLSDARTAGANVVLYGHTHVPDCHREEDGLWVMNPGSCGYHGGSAGLIELRDGKIKVARLVKAADLEEFA